MDREVYKIEFLLDEIMDKKIFVQDLTKTQLSELEKLIQMRHKLVKENPKLYDADHWFSKIREVKIEIVKVSNLSAILDEIKHFVNSQLNK